MANPTSSRSRRRPAVCPDLARFHPASCDEVWRGIDLPTSAETAARELTAEQITSLLDLAWFHGDGAALEVLQAEIRRRIAAAVVEVAS